MKTMIIGEIKRPRRVGFSNFKLVRMRSLALVGLTAGLAYWTRGIVHEYLIVPYIIFCTLVAWYLTLPSQQNPNKSNFFTMWTMLRKKRTVYYSNDPVMNLKEDKRYAECFDIIQKAGRIQKKG